LHETNHIYAVFIKGILLFNYYKQNYIALTLFPPEHQILTNTVHSLCWRSTIARSDNFAQVKTIKHSSMNPETGEKNSHKCLTHCNLHGNKW